SSVDWSGDRVLVKTNQGNYSGDRLIITLPLGVLKRGDVSFSPAMPAPKRAAIQALGMGVLNKCYLRFAKVFWPAEIDWLEHIPSRRGEWNEWVSFKRAANLPILLGFNAADRGREIESLSDQAIVSSAMQTLRKIFGSQIPDPVDYQISRWASDPFARGSYSFNALGSTPNMRDDLAETLDEMLYFAGEATEREHFSTTHGAYLSGLRVADEIMA
ncbi:MAG: amine oxidase, partial [Candidatus Melainabacteria bacterium HGW-Melainabacteria-1]